MGVSTRAVMSVCVGVLLVMALVPTTPAITIHPAVLKNFVGPYRKPGEPVLRPSYDRSRYLRQRLMQEATAAGLRSRQPEALLAEGALAQEPAYPVAAGAPAPPEEWNRPLRSCTGSASCAQNMDNTLNLLMRMMETGRR
ncbi:uncharacterized protein [Panulirus ornatus]|uniref:uncharacterized protein n=1 Tax=Panulirus ornatus TaxID=150431 RepID=UPI003A8B550C